MIEVHISNNSEILIQKICKIFKNKPLFHPLQEEIFIIDNIKIAQWIKIIIAKKLGISANIKYYKPFDFIFKTFQYKIINDNNTSEYHDTFLFWNILKLYENYKINIDFINIKDSQLKKINFALYTSKMFQKYLIYRPHWIDYWKLNINIPNILPLDQLWQKKLWFLISKTSQQTQFLKLNFTKLLDKYLTNIQKNSKNKNSKKSRIIIFGMHQLNSTYLSIFSKMSNIYEVILLYYSPHSFIYQNMINLKINDSHHKQNERKKIYISSILKNFAQSDFSNLLLLNSIQKNTFFHLKKKNNFLRKIQFIITNQKKKQINTIKNNIKKDNILTEDQSISINICNTLQREIEILKNKLLYILNENPKIMPYDIVVMSTNINLYTPFIHGVFSKKTEKDYIPYIISNEKSLIKDPLFEFFEKILDLSTNNFDIDQIFYFLEMPFISKKFHMQETKIKLLKNHLKQINVKWGLNKKHLSDISIPCKEYNTWQYGINRILLSYSMGSTKKNWNNIFTYNLSNDSINKLIGKLSEFIDTIDKWRQKLKHSKLLKNWFIIIQELIDDFFYKEDKLTNKKLNLIENQWRILINTGIQNKYKKKIEIRLLKDQIFLKIQQQTTNQQLFVGSTIFCDLTTLKGIPFKVTCILGLDQKIDYYENKLESFDLMKKYPNIHDPNIKNKYNILILEFFLLTKKYFYASYIKDKNNNNFRSNASLFIKNIINITEKNFFLKGDETLNLKNQSKNIISHLCYVHEKHPYVIKNFQVNKPYNSFDIIWYNFIHLIKKQKLKFSSSLKLIDKKKINLKEITKFWTHPVRYFFNNRLKIKFDLIENNEKNTEPFQLNALNSYKLNKDIFKTIIQQKNLNKIFEKYEKSGILPHGNFGITIFEQHEKKIISLIKKLFLIRRFPKKKSFFLQINQHHIYGSLSEVCKSGLIKCHPKVINLKDIISLWIEHLIYCLLGGKKDSIILGLNDSTWQFANLKTGTAYYYLSYYLEGYIFGLNKPLLLTQSGFEWLKVMYEKKTKLITTNNIKIIKGSKKLLQIWKGNDYKLGEKEDIYFKKIIPNLKSYNIKDICNISKRWLLPILMHKKIK